MTVFPTPAPPNRPIFPPFTNGAIRSMTLIPSRILPSWAPGHELRVSRWIGQRSASGGMGSPSSNGSRARSGCAQRRLAHGHRDRLAGIHDDHAAAAPPSVEVIATARTWLRPMCCCTSAVNRIAGRRPRWIDQHRLWISGRCSGSKSTSSTGPMTCTTLPMFCAGFLRRVAMRYPFQSFRPATISASSCVICACARPIVGALQQPR